MTTIRIHDWDTWQSFRKDRGAPPWIKVHRCLLSCRKWASLTDAEKGQLVSIWMVAADNNGEILGDPKAIRKICQLDEIPDIQRFIGLGLMETICPQVGANLTTSCQPVAETVAHFDPPEESRVEESRVEDKQHLGDKPPVSVPPKKDYTESVNEIFTHWKTTHVHPQARMDDKRRKLIISRLGNGYSVDDLKDAVTGCKYSPFHQGDNDRHQKYDSLELILREAGKIDGFIRLARDPESRPTVEQPIVKETAAQRYHRELNETQRRMEAAMNGKANLAIGAN